MEALEALYGFGMWIVKAAAVMALVAAVVAVPACLVSAAWHRLVRGDRRCAQCGAWVRIGRDQDADPTTCRGCRVELVGGLTHPAPPPGA